MSNSVRQVRVKARNVNRLIEPEKLLRAMFSRYRKSVSLCQIRSAGNRVMLMSSAARRLHWHGNGNRGRSARCVSRARTTVSKKKKKKREPCVVVIAIAFTRRVTGGIQGETVCCRRRAEAEVRAPVRDESPPPRPTTRTTAVIAG